jgi:hypothetical protein
MFQHRACQDIRARSPPCQELVSSFVCLANGRSSGLPAPHSRVGEKAAHNIKKEKDRNPTSGFLPLGILADIDRD